MEKLPQIRNRIAGLAELHDLVRGLQALAVTHARESQISIDGSRRHAAIVERAIAGAAMLMPAGKDQRERPGKPRPGVLITVCGEHGFVGAFNEHLIKRARTERQQAETIVVVGRRGVLVAAEQGLEVAQQFSMTTHVGGVTAVARHVCDDLSWAESVRIVHAIFRSGISYGINVKRILPLPPELLVHGTWQERPLFQLKSERLLAGLAAEYLFAQVSHALIESLASENVARLQRMQSADMNISAKLDGLRQRERMVRQEEITEELIEVMTGAEAVLQKRPSERK